MAIITVMVFFISDRVLKYFLINNTAIKNKGIAFGISIPENLNFIFYIILFIIIIFLTHWLIKSWLAKKRLEVIALLLIIVGAASNIIDRIKYGAVIDFIDLKFWPVFNIGDMMIVSGVILLIINFSLCQKYFQPQ